MQSDDGKEAPTKKERDGDNVSERGNALGRADSEADLSVEQASDAALPRDESSSHPRDEEQEEDDLPELTLGEPVDTAPEATAVTRGDVPPELKIGGMTGGPNLRISPGGRIGRYLLYEQIGEGGMATIFRAMDTRDGRIVAVKALHAHQNKGLAGRRFQREFRAVHSLVHPNLVQVYDYSEVQGQPFIVMEYVKGHDLKAHLKILRAMEPEQRWEEIRGLTVQICRALECIHERNIIHRDLKPSNILLTEDGRAKLTDFGVAKPQDVSMQLTQAGMLVGTLAYLAPEVFEQAKLDPRVDLYALGVMLYVMLTSKLPFSGKSIAQIMQKHLKHTPIPPHEHNPQVPEYLEKITLRLLAKDPNRRFQTAAEVLRALEAGRGNARTSVEVLEPEGGEQQWSPRLVGRSHAMLAIEECISFLVRGTGAVLVVEGAAGVGKSRVVEAGVGMAQAQGIRLYRGSCLHGGQAWGEGMRRVIAAVESEARRTGHVSDALKTLLNRFKPEEPAPPTRPSGQGGPIEDELALLFTELTAQSPRALWIDDVHLADAGTLRCIDALSRRLIRAGMPLLLILTVQPGEPSAPAVQALSIEKLGLRPRRIVLQPLEFDHVRELLESMYPRDPRVDPLAVRLHAMSGGNPLHLVEMIRVLVARGRMGQRVVEGKRKWVMALTNEEIRTQLRFPGTLRGLLQARLSIYPNQTRTLLRLIAVWGRELWFSTLLRLASASESAVGAHVDRLLADGWLAEDWSSGREAYVLAHPFYRLELLSELTATEQKRLRAFIDVRLNRRTSARRRS